MYIIRCYYEAIKRNKEDQKWALELQNIVSSARSIDMVNKLLVTFKLDQTFWGRV